VAEVDCFQFDKFLLYPRAGGLFRVDDEGARVNIPVGARALEVLSVLVANAGQLVLKHTIMDAVWSGAAVEESNLTVQISALRRALNNGEAEASLIQTIPGRGYRFVPSVTRMVASPVSRQEPEPIPPATSIRPGRRRLQAILVFMCVGVLLVSAVWRVGFLSKPQPPPRLSVVVLPFENLSGNHDEDHLADAITDDLTSELSQISGAIVIARQSAYTYKSKAADVREIGQQLGVRYILEGSVRRLGSTLRVNAQLVSSETGAHLWSDRFDESISDLASGQDQVVKRMRDGIGISLIDIENGRSAHERPNNPDALDLTIRARDPAFAGKPAT
jgi:TolB-like protein/DNA-binding winged helix-turn-helix (wHTH) protein